MPLRRLPSIASRHTLCCSNGKTRRPRREGELTWTWTALKTASWRRCSSPRQGVSAQDAPAVQPRHRSDAIIANPRTCHRSRRHTRTTPWGARPICDTLARGVEPVGRTRRARGLTTAR